MNNRDKGYENEALKKFNNERHACNINMLIVTMYSFAITVT